VPTKIVTLFYDINNTLTIMTKANVLMVGTGEYTTGYVDGKGADSDKSAGVVALAMFDLRRRGKVDRVGMCGVNVSI
jgi:D-galacturonate reductase